MIQFFRTWLQLTLASPCISLYFFDYKLYERFCEGKTTHFVPSSEVDLGSDVVWEPGQGDQIRAQDQKDSETKESQ